MADPIVVGQHAYGQEQYARDGAFDVSLPVNGGDDRAFVAVMTLEGYQDQPTGAISCVLDPGGANEQSLQQIVRSDSLDNHTSIFVLLEDKLPAPASYTFRFGWVNTALDMEAAVLCGGLNLANVNQEIPTNFGTDEGNKDGTSIPFTTQKLNSLVFSGASSDPNNAFNYTFDAYAAATQLWDDRPGNNNSRHAAAYELRAVQSLIPVTYKLTPGAVRHHTSACCEFFPILSEGGGAMMGL